MTHMRLIELFTRLARVLDKRGATETFRGLPIDPSLMPIDLAGHARLR